MPSTAATRLRRLQEAIASGVDPVALVDVINEAQRERAAARAELERAPSLADLHTGIDLQVLYEPKEKVADVSVRLGRRVNSVLVSEGELRTNHTTESRPHLLITQSRRQTVAVVVARQSDSG